MKVIKETYHLFNQKIKSVIPFIIIYTVIITFVLNILMKFIISFTLSTTGIKYISNNTFIPWLKSPITLIVLLLSLMIYIFLFLTGIFCLIRIFSKTKHSLNMKELFYTGFLDACHVFKHKSIGIMFFSSFLIPLTGFMLMSPVTKGFSVINFILNYIETHNTYFIIAIIIFIYCMILSTFWIFSMHYYLLGNKSGKESIECSKKEMKHNFFKLFFGRMLIILSCIFIYILLAVVFFGI